MLCLAIRVSIGPRESRLTKSAGCTAPRRVYRAQRSFRLRTMLAAGFGAAALIVADSAHAKSFGIFGLPFGNWFAPAHPYYHKPRHKPVETTRKEQGTKLPPGPLLIAISIGSQRLTLYNKGAPLAHSPISTGVPGHPTPTGVFSVIGKEKFHRSNLYSNAPMPFMQRITWSGVAIHQGVLPGYPASHGCIRVPSRFAQYLWATTRLGARVIITQDEVAPFEIEHAKLFVPKPNPDQDEAAGNRSLKVAESDDPVRSTDAPKTAGAGRDEPATVAAKVKAAADVPKPVAIGNGPIDSGRAAAEPSGAAAESIDKGGRAADRELKDVPHMSDPVSVFVSRKTGRLYVRQAFEPVFEAAVTIRDPEIPLGTHLYTATEFKSGQTAMRWVAVTLPDNAAPAEPDPPRRTHRKGHEAHEPVVEVPAAARLAAAAALDRVDIPKDAAERIADLLSPGATLIISDYPISGETGKYTDFIILTR